MRAMARLVGERTAGAGVRVDVDRSRISAPGRGGCPRCRVDHRDDPPSPRATSQASNSPSPAAHHWTGVPGGVPTAVSRSVSAGTLVCARMVARCSRCTTRTRGSDRSRRASSRKQFAGPRAHRDEPDLRHADASRAAATAGGDRPRIERDEQAAGRLGGGRGRRKGHRQRDRAGRQGDRAHRGEHNPPTDGHPLRFGGQTRREGAARRRQDDARGYVPSPVALTPRAAGHRGLSSPERTSRPRTSCPGTTAA